MTIDAKKSRLRPVALFLLGAMLLALMPLTGIAAEEAEQQEDTPPVPEEILDNYPLRALDYLGYDVAGLVENGKIYQDGWYGTELSSDYYSDINYSGKSFGVGTVKDPSTPTGQAPDVALYEKYGLDCTAFASYYYFNYLRNVEGVDVDDLWDNCFKFDDYGELDADGKTARIVFNWNYGAKRAVKTGRGILVGKSTDALCDAQAGDLVVFRYKAKENKRMHHVSIYIGEYNGTHFIAHISSNRGPEIINVDAYKDSEVCGIYRFHATSGTPAKETARWEIPKTKLFTTMENVLSSNLRYGAEYTPMATHIVTDVTAAEMVQMVVAQIIPLDETEEDSAGMVVRTERNKTMYKEGR